MVAYARARAKSWLSLLWTDPSIKHETADLDNLKELEKNHKDQKKNFLKAIKNGGMWFS